MRCSAAPVPRRHHSRSPAPWLRARGAFACGVKRRFGWRSIVEIRLTRGLIQSGASRRTPKRFAQWTSRLSLKAPYSFYNLSVMQPVGYELTPSDLLDATFAALADPTRRAILARLATGEASVTELAEPFDMSQPAISKHLKVLERAGLITRGRDAQRRPCRLEAVPLAGAADWLDRYRTFWEASFQRLDSLLDEIEDSAGDRTTLAIQDQNRER